MASRRKPLPRTGRPTLQMRRLAIHVIEREDREAAQVLGDAMLERGLDSIETGRVRMIPYRVMLVRTGASFRQAMTNPIANVVAERTISFPAHETLEGVADYASKPTHERWLNRVWNKLEAKPRDVWRELRRQGHFQAPNAVSRHLHWTRFAFDDYPNRGPGYLVSAVKRDPFSGKPKLVPYFIVEETNFQPHLETAYRAKAERLRRSLLNNFQDLGKRDRSRTSKARKRT